VVTFKALIKRPDYIALRHKPLCFGVAPEDAQLGAARLYDLEGIKARDKESCFAGGARAAAVKNTDAPPGIELEQCSQQKVGRDLYLTHTGV